MSRSIHGNMRRSGKIGSGPGVLETLKRGLTTSLDYSKEVAEMDSISVEERFWIKVDKTGSCWTWQGSLTHQGYGQFSPSNTQTVRAHRYAYELIVGPIPEGLVIDHVCRNRACVNPSHLEAVTNAENVRRGIGPTAVNARKKRCDEGHKYTPENTYETVTGYRRCRKCDAAWARRQRVLVRGIARECGAPARRGPCTRIVNDLAPCRYHGDRTENADV